MLRLKMFWEVENEMQCLASRKIYFEFLLSPKSSSSEPLREFKPQLNPNYSSGGALAMCSTVLQDALKHVTQDAIMILLEKA